MTPPTRFRLSRALGAAMPEGGVKCDRSTRFGNPFRCAADPAVAVAAFEAWLDGEPVPAGEGLELAMQPTPGRRRLLLESLPALRGRPLGCWCALDAAACHVDALLERANRPAAADPLGPVATVLAANLAREMRAHLPVEQQAAEALAPRLLAAALRAGRDFELHQRVARPHSARRNAETLGRLADALRSRPGAAPSTTTREQQEEPTWPIPA